MNKFSRIRNSLPFIFYYIPFIFYIFYIYSFGVNIPFWDEVDTTIPLLNAQIHHTLTLHMLWGQHNEHRIFFPSLIALFILSHSKANVVAEMFFSSFLLFGVITILLIYTTKKLRINPWLLIPIPLIILSPIQWENSLWGFQIAFYLVVFTFVISIFFLQKALFDETGKIKNILIAVFFALIGSYSSLQGLLVWLIGLFFVVQSQILETKKSNILITIKGIWIFAALIVNTLYFYGWSHPGYHPSMMYPIQHLDQGTLYFVNSIGGWIGDPKSAFLFGGIFLFLYLILLFYKIGDKRFMLPVGLILFGLCFDMMILFGRSGFGAGQALSSRYTTFNLLSLSGTYILLVSSIKDWSLKKFGLLYMALFFVFIGIMIPSYINGLKSSKIVKDSRSEMAKEAVLLNKANPNILRQLLTNQTILLKQLEFLKKRDWSVFGSYRVPR
uniref:Glycosyltransferase RgtA/B/C/D-like domain-containing protein n=1 Tax=Leptospirillum sp. Group II '5-way CG' TaxID=419541 RepID=B6ARX9_9BACT|nr:MAG: Conserved hypothetical protein [Leptospirillum sp. Group II '5-way CG']